MSLTIIKGTILSAPAPGQLEAVPGGYLVAEDGVIRRNYRHLSRKGFNIWQKRRPRA